jgi:hypothetical protein
MAKNQTITFVTGIGLSFAAAFSFAQSSHSNMTEPKKMAAPKLNNTGSYVERVPTTGLVKQAKVIDQVATLVERRLTPAGRVWTQENARKLLKGELSLSTIRSQATIDTGLLLSTLGDGQGVDAEALVFMVLKVASSSDNHTTRTHAQSTKARETQTNIADENSTELNMIDIQQLMSKRAQILQMSTSMLNSVSESTKGITNSIR